MGLQVEILANPSSGRGRGPERAGRIAELLGARGHAVEMFAGTSREDATAWAARAGAEADRLVVVGGDGTLNAVLDGLPEDAAAPVVLSPLGTANLVAFGLKLEPSPHQAAKLVEDGREQHVDLAQARYSGADGRERRRAVMCAGFGFDGELMRRFDEGRDGPVHRAAYLKYLGEVLREWHPVPQRVRADGEDLGEFVYGVVTGFGVYGMSQLKLGPCTTDDGLWELTLFPDVSLLRTSLAALTAVGGGQVSKVPGVVQRTVRRVSVHAEEPTPLQVDGDYVGVTPLELHLDGTQVPFLVQP